MIGSYEFPQEFVWTNGAQSSLKVSVDVKGFIPKGMASLISEFRCIFSSLTFVKEFRAKLTKNVLKSAPLSAKIG